MKKMLRHSRAVAVISLLVLLMTSPVFAAQPITSISSSEAAQVALHYYCLNRPDDSLVTLDEYEVTPLYDEAGNITYYSVDFFYEGTPKGYVVISKDLNNLLCPEFNYDKASIYYQNALDGIETVYYNPFEVFMIEEETGAITTLGGEEVTEEDVGGTIVPGDLQDNISYTADMFVTDDPLTSREVFAEHPTEYLRSNGYTSVASSSTFGTIESEMEQADCFWPMYQLDDPLENPNDTKKKTLTNGTVIYNAGHCSITAISNILMYWRDNCCSRYPANYEDMFSVVMQKSIDMGYFSNTKNGSGLSITEAINVIDAVNDSYNYNGVANYYEMDNVTWGEIKAYINADWPLFMGFNAAENTFTYTAHAVVVFGYNIVSGWKNNDYEECRFLKIYDGHDDAGRGKCYISYDMLEYYCYIGSLEIENEDGSTTILDENPTIDYRMFAFCPYTP